MRALLLLLIFSLIGCQKSKDISIKTNLTNSNLEIAVLSTSKGEIHMKFLPNKAPRTVKRIKELIQDEFYTGIQFHRVIPSFVIQAGDPTGTGVGGSGKKLNAEFNDELHVKGTVAMARLGHDENSADSQFYIALSTLPHLDKNYTVFAKVTRGVEVLDKIKKGDKILSFKMLK